LALLVIVPLLHVNSDLEIAGFRGVRAR